MASPYTVDTASTRTMKNPEVLTVKKPKITTAKKPRKEDLLKAVLMSMERGSQRVAVRTVKKTVLRRSSQVFSSTADVPSETANSEPDDSSDASIGNAGSSHVRPRRVHGVRPKAVHKPVNRRSASELNSKSYCHQCRNRNMHPKMRCKGYRIGDRACQLAFCRNCIIKRLVRRPVIATLVVAYVQQFTVIRIFNSTKTRTSCVQNALDAATAARAQPVVARYMYPVD